MSSPWLLGTTRCPLVLGVPSRQAPPPAPLWAEPTDPRRRGLGSVRSHQPRPALHSGLRSSRGHGGGRERPPRAGRGGHSPGTGGGCLTPSQTAGRGPRVHRVHSSTPPSTGRPLSPVWGTYLGSLSPAPARSEILDGVRSVSDPGPRPQKAQCPRLLGPAPRGPPAGADLQPHGGSETWLEPGRGPGTQVPALPPLEALPTPGLSFPICALVSRARRSQLPPRCWGTLTRAGSRCLTFPGCAGQVGGGRGQPARASGLLRGPSWDPSSRSLWPLLPQERAGRAPGRGQPAWAPRAARGRGHPPAAGGRECSTEPGEMGFLFPPPSPRAPATGWR